MQLLEQGAEARLYLTNYLDKKAILKERTQKTYREKALDSKILKERLRTECNLLSRAKLAGVRTPFVWKILPENNSFIMEFIKGKTMKAVLGKKNKNAEDLCKKAGEIIGKLHSKDIIHGDLTSSNFIVHENELVLVDFGLGSISSRLEDKAVDLLNFRKTFMATHFTISNLWKSTEEQYLKNYSSAAAVLKHIESIEARARYA